jgi:hypothetical protein
MKRISPNQMGRRNFVAKYAHKFNRNVIHRDKRKAVKLGYIKHKKVIDNEA